MPFYNKTSPMLALLAFGTFALFAAACAPAGAGQMAAQEAASTVSVERPVKAAATATITPTDVPAVEPTATAYPTPAPESAQHRPQSCPVTQPPDPRFLPPEPWPERPPDGGEFWYGSAELWTALPGDGTWGQLLRGDKVLWWREGFDGSIENRPALEMVGRRLDAPFAAGRLPGIADAKAEAHTVSPATNAYHPSFNWAMLTGFEVPEPGCWEITGRYRERELTFVVWVPPQ